MIAQRHASFDDDALSDIELMLPEEKFQDKTLFPNWLHVLAPKV